MSDGLGVRIPVSFNVGPDVRHSGTVFQAGGDGVDSNGGGFSHFV